MNSSAVTIKNNYQTIVDIATSRMIPCYVAASALGLTPSQYVAALNELMATNIEILNTLRSTDLDNYLSCLKDSEHVIVSELFKPIFAYPEKVNENIPTIEVRFEDENFCCSQIKTDEDSEK